MKLRKRQVLFEKPTFEKKPIPSNQESWDLSPFLGSFKVPLFYTRIRIQQGSKFLQQSFFREEIFFQEKEKVSAFLANSTPVIRTNECQKTFGQGPRSVCNTIHAFDNTNTGIDYTCRCEKIFNGNER